MERNIQELNANYDKIDDRYSKIKEEIEEQPDNEKPLINKLKSIEYDMNKCKKKITEKEAKVEKLKRMDKYYEGELEGAEKMKAERDILLENQKRVDNQGLIIDSIQENIKVIGTNLNKENNLDFETLELMINQIKKLMNSINQKKQENNKENINKEIENKLKYYNEHILEASEQKSLSNIKKTKSFNDNYFKNAEKEKEKNINNNTNNEINNDINNY